MYTQAILVLFQVFSCYFRSWPLGVAKADPPILKPETLSKHFTPSIFVLLPVTILMRKAAE